MAQTETKKAVESEELNELSADDPLTDPKIDRLGYAPFAKHLADSICKMNFPGGFVIAVYGSWGSGKTTLSNFIVHYLKQKPEDEQPLIVPFNPWLFSGEQDITRRFFDQIQSVFNNWKFVPKGFKDRIADVAKVVSQIPLPYAQAGNAVAQVFDDKQKDASDLKKEVEYTLKQQHPRIVVTIDDIDKLEAEEIKKLFRVINAFPDFTDVVYLLFFSKEVVIKALAETQGMSGEAYLSRVIQAAFELPIPDKTSLRKLLFEKLNAVLTDTPKQLFEQTRWSNVYFAGIDNFITNIRDIVQLANTLNVAYPTLRGEVNAVDFIAIESLRVFCPTMYDTIRKNHRAFAGSTDSKDTLDYTIDELKSLHNSWIAQLPDRDKESVKQLLILLFPKLEGIWGNTYYGAQYESIWRKQLRVCSLEILPTYFRMVLPEGELPNTGMKAILASAQDAKVFGESLVELANQKRPDGTTQVRAFLERLDDTQIEIPKDSIESILQALFNVGDRLLRPEDEPCGLFDFGNGMRIHRIIWQLLRQRNEPARFEVLKQAMSNGNALSTIVREVVFLGQQQGKYGAEESSLKEEGLISEQHLRELEKIALNKVQAAAQQDTLVKTPGIKQILSYWQQCTTEEEVKQWVRQAIATDEGLVDFLEKFLETTVTQSMSDMVPRKTYRLDPQWLEAYLEPSEIVEQVRSLDDKNEFQKQSIAIKQFIQEYDIRQQGKDPNAPSAWEEVE